MRKPLLVMLTSLLLVLILVPAVGAKEGYEPVTELEKEYVNNGWGVLEFKDVYHSDRITYLFGGVVQTKEVHKRYVKFYKSYDISSELGSELVNGGWAKTKGETITLVLFWVPEIETEVLSKEVVEYVEKPVMKPVIIYEEVRELEQKPVYEEIPSAKEVKK